jgi:hypothetical protein
VRMMCSATRLLDVPGSFCAPGTLCSCTMLGTRLNEGVVSTETCFRFDVIVTVHRVTVHRVTVHRR